MKTITAGGVDIPALGLGVWQMKGEEAVRMVGEALDVGYRHIDTAFIYENEAEVGQALRASSVPRDQVFLTTKVWRDHLGAGDLQKAAEDSLRRLNQDYVDLLLIHWPNADIPLEESIDALNDVRRRGLTRSIGVANFPSAMFSQAQALSDAPLVTNQVEYHPYMSQRVLLAALQAAGSTLTAYSPLARGKVAQEPALREIAADHGVTAGQVTLRWFLQQDRVIAIPQSANPERLRQNFDVFGFTLSDEEMARVFALARPDGRMISPGFAPQWDAE